MRKVTLVVPMAGRGSRFSRQGLTQPKPLQTLWGKPFFWWATESARRAFDIGSLCFVVLREHVDAFAIDRRVLDLYPEAHLLVLPDVTRGAAETAKLAIERIAGDGPILVNDSDHAFALSDGAAVPGFLAEGAAAALLSFGSSDPAYSYVRFDDAGRVSGTVEKRVVSDRAIAGAYFFSGRGAFLDAYAGYENDCPYDEVYISGLFDRLIGAGESIAHTPLDSHISFGTPAELAQLAAGPAIQPWAAWQ